MIMHFLSGLPRSGSTVLSSLLNQHPQVHSTSTSGLVEIMGAVCTTWESSPTTIAQGADKNEAYRMLRSVMQSKYNDIDKPVVVDKSRTWVNPRIMGTMTDVLGRPPKIIATVRSTADCAASFVRIAKPNDVSAFLHSSPLIQHLKASYALLKMGFESAPQNILFVDYDDLMHHPQVQMDRIHAFLGLEPFNYNFDDIDPSVVAEKDDAAWGIANLHAISPRLGYQHDQDSKQVLGENFYIFDQPKFWKSEDEQGKNKKLDMAVRLSSEGDFDGSYNLLSEAHRENPLCNKTAFNMGWHHLRQGRLQQGMQSLARGRYENCFGNSKPPLPTSIWDGHTRGTVLYYLEGDIKDQIHALKYITDLKRKGCRVIVACSPELFTLAECCTGVEMLVDHAASGGVYHDYWIPSMSVLVILGYEYSDIRGSPHIPRTRRAENKRFTVGIACGTGEPPCDSLVDTITNVDADFVCLHDRSPESNDLRFARKVSISTWKQMQDEICCCDLVISPCTAVGHLAAGMGIPTWILVPLWSHPAWCMVGDRSPYHESVRLFRQQKSDSWAQPLVQMRLALEEEIAREHSVRGRCRRIIRAFFTVALKG